MNLPTSPNNPKIKANDTNKGKAISELITPKTESPEIERDIKILLSIEMKL